MLFQKLLQSLAPARDSTASDAAGAAKREPIHLGGSNWLVHGRHGIYLANDNDLYIGRALIHYGEYGELEWRLLARYCRSGDTVVEVGANVGAHTVSLAQAVGPAGRVIAIEPQPVVFQRLCANVALNNFLNVVTWNCGCGAAETTMAVPMMDYDAEGNFGGIALQDLDEKTPSRPIAVKRLDDVARDCARIDLLKIDVEGMELEVLGGATETIRAHRPVIYLENDRFERSRALIETLWSLGYELWWHSPVLFNPDNYFGSARNLYPRVASANMLCLHRESKAWRPDGLEAVDDAAHHPFIRGAPAAHPAS